jgi:hypothetical protein
VTALNLGTHDTVSIPTDGFATMSFELTVVGIGSTEVQGFVLIDRMIKG